MIRLYNVNVLSLATRFRETIADNGSWRSERRWRYFQLSISLKFCFQSAQANGTQDYHYPSSISHTLRTYYKATGTAMHDRSNHDNINVNAFAAANSVIIPVCPKFLDAKGMELLLKSVAQIKINPTLMIDGCQSKIPAAKWYLYNGLIAEPHTLNREWLLFVPESLSKGDIILR